MEKSTDDKGKYFDGLLCIQCSVVDTISDIQKSHSEDDVLFTSSSKQ